MVGFRVGFADDKPEVAVKTVPGVSKLSDFVIGKSLRTNERPDDWKATPFMTTSFTGAEADDTRVDDEECGTRFDRSMIAVVVGLDAGL